MMSLTVSTKKTPFINIKLHTTQIATQIGQTCIDSLSLSINIMAER